MKRRTLAVLAVLAIGASVSAFAQEKDQLTVADLAKTHPHAGAAAPRGGRNGQGHARWGIDNIDSLVNFNQHFQANGVDQNGHPQIIWYTNMVGNPPAMGGTTAIGAPIVPVSIDLRNADGTPRYYNGHRLFFDVTPFVSLAVGSPVFQNATWSSSDVPTQITDAEQRAQFYNKMKVR